MSTLIIELVEKHYSNYWSYKLTPHLENTTANFAPTQEIFKYDEAKKQAFSMAKEFLRDFPELSAVEIWVTYGDGRDERKKMWVYEQKAANFKNRYSLTPDDYLPQDPNEPNPEWDEKQRKDFKRFMQGGDE